MGAPSPDEKSLFKLVQSIRELWQGRSNAVGEFTLEANETSTTVSAGNCGPGSRISLTPRTANAAGALATTYIPAADVGHGQFTVRHDSAVSTDRSYGYAIRG